MSADHNNKLESNARGRFYVDSSCIDCDLCRESAPQFFARDDDAALSYVYRQPTEPDDIAFCEEIVDSCPVQSIGDDGDDTSSLLRP